MQFSITEKHGQPLRIVVNDADAFGKKDYVGKLDIDVSDVAEATDNVIDKWYHIYDTSRAQLHLRLIYFNLSDSPDDFHQTNLAQSNHTGYVERQIAVRQHDGTDAGGRSTGQPNSGSKHRNVTANADHTALAYLFVHSVDNLPVNLSFSCTNLGVVLTCFLLGKKFSLTFE